MKIKKILSVLLSTAMLASVMVFTMSSTASANSGDLLFKLDFSEYEKTQTEETNTISGIKDSVTNESIEYMGGTVDLDSMITSDGKTTKYLDMWGTLQFNNIEPIIQQNQISVSLWTKMDLTSGYWSRIFKVSKDVTSSDDENSVLEMACVPSENKLVWRSSRRPLNDGFLFKEVPFSPVENKWSNIVLTKTFNGKNWIDSEIYVDGTLVSTIGDGTGGPTLTSMADISADMLIGAKTSSNDGACKMKLGSFEIYNRRMNASDVSALYESQKSDFSELGDDMDAKSVSEDSLNKRGGSFSVSFTNIVDAGTLNDNITLKDENNNAIDFTAAVDDENPLIVNIAYDKNTAKTATLTIKTGIKNNIGNSLLNEYIKEFSVYDLDLISSFDLSGYTEDTTIQPGEKIGDLSANYSSDSGSITVNTQEEENYLALNSKGADTYLRADFDPDIELATLGRAVVVDFDIRARITSPDYQDYQANVGFINNYWHGTMLLEGNAIKIDVDNLTNQNEITNIVYKKDSATDFHKLRYVLTKEEDGICYGYIYDRNDLKRKPYMFTTPDTDLTKLDYFTAAKIWRDGANAQAPYAFLDIKNFSAYYADISNVIYAKNISDNDIVVAFDSKLDTVSSQDVNNYSVNGVAPVNAVYNAVTEKVTLTMEEALSSDTVYEVVLSGVKDDNDLNVMGTASFTKADINPILTIAFTNDSDEALTTANVTGTTAINANVSLALDADAQSDKEFSAKVFMAVYGADGALKGIATSDIACECGKNNIKDLSITELDSASAYSIKMFVWDGHDNMVPKYDIIVPHN